MIGAHIKDDNICEFRVWAPLRESLSLKIVSPEARLIPMQDDGQGYWKAAVDDVPAGTNYYYRLEGDRDRPDPASYFQPQGVHKASQVFDHRGFAWGDSGWQGLALSEMIMYELHVGTFTPEGTFDAAVRQLDDLKDIGINAVEIMPVAQFPGDRNWGYDGVYPFAVQDSYGGPDGLKRFVNECHQRGLAVILDVVYNHLGPEGNYLWDFGPYFTDRYKTPWGQAINFDGPGSNEVRGYFIANALYWFEHYHIDALRLDAVHGIYDMSARHFLRELSEKVQEFSENAGRKFSLIAESDLNNSLVAESRERSGYGIDALWCDDFHHSVHTLLTGESEGYYIDFGNTTHLKKSLKEGFVYTGEYSAYRKRNHGNSSERLPAAKFVAFAQNHDQTGNRMFGERLSGLVSYESQKLGAGIILLSPFVPLLFMGEEYGETAPFLYFVSHADPHLIEGIRQGRRKEFQSFGWTQEPPDPQSIETFRQSKIDWTKRTREHHGILLELYRELIRLRREQPALAALEKNNLEVLDNEEENVVSFLRWKDSNKVLAIFNFRKEDLALNPSAFGTGWKKLLDSSDTKWKGPGALMPGRISGTEQLSIRAESFLLYEKGM